MTQVLARKQVVDLALQRGARPSPGPRGAGASLPQASSWPCDTSEKCRR